jgi:phytoene synthase
MTTDEVEYCAGQLRQGDRDRWLCALFAPERGRPAVLALGAFNLELARIRDSVREPHMALIRLHWWRETVAECAAGTPRRHPVATALARLLADRQAIAPALQQMIDAREKDIEEVPFVAPTDLLAYADGTGGALARATILALDDDAGPRAEAAALALGRGSALAGLLRAVVPLARLRRCPVPAQSLARHGIDPEAWFAGRAGAPAAAVAAEIARDAAASFAGIARRDLAAAGLALGGLAVLGRAHLRRLARAGHDPFAPGLAQPAPGDALRLAWARVARRW